MENNKNFCPNCGKQINGNPTFCPNCDNKLSSSLDIDKGKETLKNVSQSTSQAFENLSKTVSKKTGHKVNAKTIIGSLVSIAIIGFVIFMLLPEHLSGTYSHSTNLLITSVKSRITFKGGNFTEDNGKKGTYKIDGNTIELEEKDGHKTNKIVGKLSKDKKSFDLMGMKYTKDEK